MADAVRLDADAPAVQPDHLFVVASPISHGRSQESGGVTGVSVSARTRGARAIDGRWWCAPVPLGPDRPYDERDVTPSVTPGDTRARGGVRRGDANLARPRKPN